MHAGKLGIDPLCQFFVAIADDNQRTSGVSKMKKITWQVAAVTDPGLKRDENQDNFFMSEDHRVLVVADGMGGMQGGSKASRIAVNAMRESLETYAIDGKSQKDLQTWLVEAVANANTRVFEAAADDPEARDMGTTIVAVVQSEEGELQIAHVGDSRAYLVRDGKTIVLTQDHSVVMEMVAQGKMTEEQLKTSPFRHYLTRCVGHKKKVEIDNTPSSVKPGDWLILSSDGLSGVVDDAEIADIVSTCDSVREACDDLLNETLARGAPDNVTIICAHYADAKKEEESEDCNSSTGLKSSQEIDIVTTEASMQDC